MPAAKRRKTDAFIKPNNFRPAEIEFVGTSITGVPFCEHGPTLLLERMKNGTVEKFYACAVCRSRKDCTFYRTFEEERRHPTSSEKLGLLKKIMKTNRGYSHKKLYERLKIYRKLPQEKRCFCTECSTLLLSTAEAKKHNSCKDRQRHAVVNGISNKQLREPSRLLKLKQNAKKESQFLFTRDTLEFFAENIIKKFEFDGVLCIGTPTLQEFCHKKARRNLCKSFLLDVDYRYAQFWSPRFFAQFSMFNGYFYTPLGEKCYRRFLSDVTKLLIVVDPPFGGLITALTQTLLRLKRDVEEAGRHCEIILVSPYFMEQKILNALPRAAMLDYKVIYDDGNALAPETPDSRIRIFTTLQPDTVELPSDLGYRFCEECKRYVAPENRHCKVCGACTSKDGRPYVHCDKCGKCVKSRYKHCKKCDICHEKSTDNRVCRPVVRVCQICKEDGHVWVNCPKKDKEENGSSSATSKENLKSGPDRRSSVSLKEKGKNLKTSSKNDKNSETNKRTRLKRKLSFDGSTVGAED